MQKIIKMMDTCTVNIIDNTKEFANQVTTNLFKKKIKTKLFKSATRASSKRNGIFIPRKMERRNKNTKEKLLPKITYTISNSTDNPVLNVATLDDNLVAVEEIANQVNTPFSSSVVNSKNESDFYSRELFYLPSQQNYDSYSVNLYANQASQTNNSMLPVTASQKHTSEKTSKSPDQTLEIGVNSRTSSHSDKETESSKTQTVPNDDLTPLSWLQSLDMCGVVPHLSTPPTPPASPPLGNNSSGGEKKKDGVPEAIDYSKDGSVKPPYSYAALIGMAMKENGNKMTLSSIYKWIKEHYIYYKTADQSWQNSIRHNLSLNKCFLKVARSKDEPGKGGFWKLDPEYADSLVDGVFKKRRPSRGTAPPATKVKRAKRQFSYNQQQQIQHEVQRQRQREHEEFLRQKEQEEAVKSLLQQPVQEAYMPPPTNKPPSISTIYMNQQEPIEQTLLVDENGTQLKDDFVWSSFIGEEVGQDETWQLGAQEVVTDITQSGDPSTYQVTASPTHTNNSLSSPTSSQSIICTTYNQQQILHPQQATQHIQNLPSFELSPESLGVEEDLFGTPEYSEASNDEGDSLISSFDLGVGGSLDLAVSATIPWENKAGGEVYHHHNGAKEHENLQPFDQGTLITADFHDFEGNLTQLTTLEPAAPVVVQQIQQPGWNSEQCWDEAKTFSLLEANLDFDKLIDLDVLS